MMISRGVRETTMSQIEASTQAYSLGNEIVLTPHSKRVVVSWRRRAFLTFHQWLPLHKRFADKRRRIFGGEAVASDESLQRLRRRDLCPQNYRSCGFVSPNRRSRSRLKRPNGRIR